MTQPGLVGYMTKSESQSFRIRSKVGVAFAQQQSCWRRQQSASNSKSAGKQRAKLWQYFWAGKHCCVVLMQVTSLKPKAC